MMAEGVELVPREDLVCDGESAHLVVPLKQGYLQPGSREITSSYEAVMTSAYDNRIVAVHFASKLALNLFMSSPTSNTLPFPLTGKDRISSWTGHSALVSI